MAGSTEYDYSILAKYCRDAHDVIRSGVPTLYYGEKGVQSTSTSATVKVHFTGEVAEWESFKEEAIAFYQSKGMQEALKRTSGHVITIDPGISRSGKYEHFMTDEVLQVGAKISLSGPFFNNVLAPVTILCQVLNNPHYGKIKGSPNLPKNPVFGDSWTHRVRYADAQPDIMMKISSQDAVRLVGELKTPVSVTLGKVARNAAEKFAPNSKTILCGVLGQVVNYMVTYSLKYAFLSNYDQTIFIKQDHKENGKPCIYFSRAIRHTDITDPRSKDRSVSLMRAMLFLMSKSCGPNEKDWKLPDEIETSEWIGRDPAPPGTVGTPYSSITGKRDAPVAGLSRGLSSLSLTGSSGTALPTALSHPSDRTLRYEARNSSSMQPNVQNPIGPRSGSAIFPSIPPGGQAQRPTFVSSGDAARTAGQQDTRRREEQNDSVPRGQSSGRQNNPGDARTARGDKGGKKK